MLALRLSLAILVGSSFRLIGRVPGDCGPMMPGAPDEPQVLESATADRPSARPISASRIISARDLFGTEREVLIEHQASYYRLRLTRASKLILHK